MRAGGGKAKGAQFEREVCTLLSRWITDNKQHDVFWRSAMSGGRATVAAKKGEKLSNQVGDITCIDPAGAKFIERFAVECKFYKDLEFGGLLTGRGKIHEFWNEIKKQAATVGKLPILFARQNRMPVLVCLDYFGIQEFKISEWDVVLFSPADNLYIVSKERFITCEPLK